MAGYWSKIFRGADESAERDAPSAPPEAFVAVTKAPLDLPPANLPPAQVSQPFTIAPAAPPPADTVEPAPRAESPKVEMPQKPSQPAETPMQLERNGLNAIGRQNEALRNSLSEIEVSFAHMDVLRNSFRDVFGAMVNLFSDLEQSNTSLQENKAILSLVSAEHDMLKSRHGQLEREFVEARDRAGALEQESRHYEQVARQSEAALQESILELREKTSRVDNLDRIAQAEIQRSQALADDLGAMTDTLHQKDKVLAELERELAVNRDQNGLLTHENAAVLKMAQEHAIGVTALTRRNSELGNELDALRRTVADLEAALEHERTGHTKLRSEYEEISVAHQAEKSNAEYKLEAISARASTAERILADARLHLRDRAAEVRQSERKALDAQMHAANLEKRIATLEKAQAEAAEKTAELENSRATLIEHSSALSKTVKAKDLALQKAEQKLDYLNIRLADQERVTKEQREQVDKRMSELTEFLEKERTARAFAEGALQAARKDRLDMQKELILLREGARRGREDVSPAKTQPVEKPSTGIEAFDDNVARMPMAANLIL